MVNSAIFYTIFKAIDAIIELDRIFFASHHGRKCRLTRRSHNPTIIDVSEARILNQIRCLGYHQYFVTNPNLILMMHYELLLVLWGELHIIYCFPKDFVIMVENWDFKNVILYFQNPLKLIILIIFIFQYDIIYPFADELR